MDPLEMLGLSAGARVLVLGNAARLLRPDPARFWVTWSGPHAGWSEPPECFEGAVSAGFLEHPEWDRWALPQVHRALERGRRMVLVATNMLASCGAADGGDVAARAGRLATRALAKALRRPAGMPCVYSRRRFLAPRLRAMLHDLGSDTGVFQEVFRTFRRTVSFGDGEFV